MFKNIQKIGNIKVAANTLTLPDFSRFPDIYFVKTSGKDLSKIIDKSRRIHQSIYLETEKIPKNSQNL